MPSVGLRGDENVHPGSGLSALLSRKGTHCSHMAEDILNAKKITKFSLATGKLCRRDIKLPEKSLVVQATEGLRSRREGGSGPGLCNSFCFCIKSDERKCIAVLSTAETFWEALYIYEMEDNCRTTGGYYYCLTPICFEEHEFIKILTFKCVIAYTSFYLRYAKISSNISACITSATVFVGRFFGWFFFFSVFWFCFGFFVWGCFVFSARYL